MLQELGDVRSFYRVDFDLRIGRGGSFCRTKPTFLKQVLMVEAFTSYHAPHTKHTAFTRLVFKSGTCFDVPAQLIAEISHSSTRCQYNALKLEIMVLAGMQQL